MKRLAEDARAVSQKSAEPDPLGSFTESEDDDISASLTSRVNAIKSASVDGGDEDLLSPSGSQGLNKPLTGIALAGSGACTIIGAGADAGAVALVSRTCQTRWDRGLPVGTAPSRARDPTVSSCLRRTARGADPLRAACAARDADGQCVGCLTHGPLLLRSAPNLRPVAHSVGAHTARGGQVRQAV